MDNYINDFFKTKLTIKNFCKQNDLDTETFSDRLEELGYIISSRQSGETIFKIKSAISEYKNSKRTCGQIARKFSVPSSTLKKVLEELNILDITRTTRKYNEHIFDFPCMCPEKSNLRILLCSLHRLRMIDGTDCQFETIFPRILLRETCNQRLNRAAAYRRHRHYAAHNNTNFTHTFFLILYKNFSN